MLEVVKAWKRLFAADGVDARTLEMLEGAILPASFFQTQPLEMVQSIALLASLARAADRG